MKGIINVREENDNYIVQIIYNYAHIEVKTDEYNLNKTILNALTIVTSIQYNDDVIKSLIGKSSYSYSEEKIENTKINYLFFT